MSTEPEEDEKMTTEKKRHLRAVNPKEKAPPQPLLDASTKKQLLIGFFTTLAVVGAVEGARWLYHVYGSGGQKKPEAKAENPNPLLPGNVTAPPMFQSPYSQMMRAIPAPMQAQAPPMPHPMQVTPPAATEVNPDEPPKWFSEWATMMEKRIGKVEKKKSQPLRKKIDAYDNDEEG